MLAGCSFLNCFQGAIYMLCVSEQLSGRFKYQNTFRTICLLT